jgi:hypothetical protein
MLRLNSGTHKFKGAKGEWEKKMDEERMKPWVRAD